MKVLFQSRVDLYNPRGGDTIQMEQTKKAIEKLDSSIKIDIDTSIKKKDISKYDIVHLFNLDWIPETYLQAKWAKENGKKIVLSAIHHSEKEVLLFEKEARFGIRRLYNAIIPWQSMRDVWKNIYRSIFNYKKAYPTLVQLFKGIRNEQREIVKMSDVIVVQTKEEAIDIGKDFNVKNFKWKKVVNGVNVDVFYNARKSFKGKKKKIILNVGRIEPRKNQLSLIKAFELLQKEEKYKDFKLVFIGALSKNHPEYVYRFKKLVKENSNISYLGVVSLEKVAKHMSESLVYAHTSWFETTGLVCLEAAVSGLSIVATGTRVREYIGNKAYYCKPDDIISIKNGLVDAIENPVDIEGLQKDVKKTYSWEEAAKQTISIYNSLMN